VSFSPAGNVFEKIFRVGEADLIVEYYTRDRTRKIEEETVLNIEQDLYDLTYKKSTIVSFQNQLDVHIDREKLLLYDVNYDHIYRVLRTAFKENRFATLRSHQEYLPITLGSEEKTIMEVLNETLIDVSVDNKGRKSQLALSTFVEITSTDDLKTIVAG